MDCLNSLVCRSVKFSYIQFKFWQHIRKSKIIVIIRKIALNSLKYNEFTLVHFSLNLAVEFGKSIVAQRNLVYKQEYLNFLGISRKRDTYVRGMGKATELFISDQIATRIGTFIAVYIAAPIVSLLIVFISSYNE